MNEQIHIGELDSAPADLTPQAIDPATGKADEFLTDNDFSYAGYAINRFDDYVVISVQGKKNGPKMKPQLDKEEGV